MTARVEWLPVGHITHGYRRVFAIIENNRLRHVVNFAPMPYELVYRVREMADQDEVKDPSLWWGLSIIASLVSDGTLLGASNRETGDDGYLQMRPLAPDTIKFIPLSVYRESVENGALVFSH